MIMKKIIALALVTSFAVTGTALAQTAGGPNGGRGGNEGPDVSDSNGAQPILIRITRRPTRREVYAPKIVEYCHTGSEILASDNECSHYSR